MSKEQTQQSAGTIQLPLWMYRQIINDDTAKAVWCYCDAQAISYGNGMQFVCLRGHWGVPMKTLRPRPDEQVFLDEQRTKGRESLRIQFEAEEAKRQRRRRKRQ